MSWYNVASAGSLEALQTVIPGKYQEIPIGKRTRIILNTSPFPIAPLFDVAGAEMAAKLLVHGGQLIDVYGEGTFQAVIEIESVDSASAAMSGDYAEMALPQVIVWIGVIAGVLVLLPIVVRLATMMANFVPTGGNGGGGGIFDYLTTLFGDYTPYVLIGGAILLFVLLKPKASQQAPVIYNIPSGSTRKRG